MLKQVSPQIGSLSNFPSRYNTGGSRVLNIYMVKPEIPVGKSNGSCHSVCEASENMGCDLRRSNFASLFSLFSWFAYTSPTTSTISLVLCFCT